MDEPAENLVLAPTIEWPSNAKSVLIEDVVALSVRSDEYKEPSRMFDDLVLRDFIADLKHSGLTLQDMVTDRGSFGFEFQDAIWTDETHGRVMYTYSSRDYGTVSVTFVRLQQRWFPEVLKLVKLPAHKKVSDAVVQFNYDRNRIKYYDRFDGEFPEAAPEINKVESIYTVKYVQEVPEGEPLPTSFSSSEMIQRGSLVSTMHVTLELTNFQSGEITTADVRNAMLEVPNGTVAFVAGDKRAWTTESGNVVEKLDAEALTIGKSTVFGSRPRLALIILFNIFLLAVLFMVFRSKLRRH